MASRQLKKKISVATVVGDVWKNALNDEKGNPRFNQEVMIMRVVGRATGIRSGISQYGEWECLKGTFSAINLITGEQTSGVECFLPSIAMAQCLDAMIEAKKVNGVVELAFDIGVKATITGKGPGTEYSVYPLIETNIENDPLVQLEARINAGNVLEFQKPVDGPPALENDASTEKAKTRAKA